LRGRRRRVTAGRGALTRTERASQARRQRALAHLERVRGHAGSPREPRFRGAVAVAVAALLASSVAAGALFGPSLVTAASGWLSGATPRLEAIRVHGLERLSAGEIAAATGLARGATPAEVVPGEVVERLEAHSWVAAARAVRLSSRTLLVDVRERVPLAVAPAGKDESPFLVDATGTPFTSAAAATSEGLPRLVPATAVAPGEPDDALAAAVALAQQLPAFGLAVPTQVRIAAAGDPLGFVVHLSGLTARFVLGREDLDDRLAGLARLLAANLVETAKATSVDLRFADQAVLRKRPPPKGAAQVAAERGGAAPSNTRPSG